MLENMVTAGKRPRLSLQEARRCVGDEGAPQHACDELDAVLG